MCKSKFTELWAFTDQGRNGIIFNLLTVLKVDLEKLTTICSEGND